MLTTREAMLILAARLRLHPEMYNFSVYGVPEPGEQGDVIGWVAALKGLDDRNILVDDGNNYDFDFAYEAVEVDEAVLYGRMDSLERDRFGLVPQVSSVWRDSAATCATVLRLYADKYHPEEYERLPSHE